jgi:hypothetical protein
MFGMNTTQTTSAKYEIVYSTSPVPSTNKTETFDDRVAAWDRVKELMKPIPRPNGKVFFMATLCVFAAREDGLQDVCKFHRNFGDKWSHSKWTRDPEGQIERD